MKRGSIFETDGIPHMSEALPLAMQHVVAMIVGCVTPAIIVSGAVPGGLSREDQVILIQSALVIAALSTLLQLFPIGGKAKFAIGSGLPIIMGVSFAYVPSMQAIAESYGIAAIMGAEIVGGIVAVVMGLLVKKTSESSSSPGKTPPRPPWPAGRRSIPWPTSPSWCATSPGRNPSPPPPAGRVPGSRSPAPTSPR